MAPIWSNGIHLNVIEASADPAAESWRNINAIDDLIFEILNTMSHLVIAGLRGNAGAGGAMLALAADRVYARSGVVLNPHYRSMGDLYGSEYWTYTLPRRVGPRRALELTLSCKPIGTRVAREMGFLDDDFGEDSEAFEAQLRERAKRLAQDPEFRLMLRKKHERRLDDEHVKPLADYRADELEQMRVNFFGPDPAYHEARRRFVFQWADRNLSRSQQPGARPKPAASTIMLARKPILGMIAGVFAASFGAAPASMLMASPARLDFPETVDVAPRVFAHRLAGDFSQVGQSVDAPLVEVARTSVLHIMKQQVTVADYDRCVAETKCMARSPPEGFDPNLPAVQVSWQDATAYAAWLSAKTGETWRLPTDEEWVFAAGSRFHDDALLVAASRDPSVRWLARFEKESEQEALDQRPRPTGAFGANEYGLSGNVWEWTNTCFIRQSLDAKGKFAGASTANCGVRVVEGEHRTYVTDFVRDARGEVALSTSRRATWDSVWFARTTALYQSLLRCDD